MSYVYRFDEVTVDEARHKVSIGNQTVPLQPTTLVILLVLLRANGRIMSRKQLIAAVWPKRTTEILTRSAIDVQLNKLRRALGAQAWRIVTVARKGYRFDGPFEVTPSDAIPSIALSAASKSETHLVERFPHLDRFVDALDSVSSIAQMGAVLKDGIESLGFELFSYMRLPPKAGPHVPLFVTNIPTGWTERYFEARHIHHDRVSLKAARSVRPFLWDETADLGETTPRQQVVVDEASEFGLHSGVIIPIAGPGGEIALLSVTNAGMPAAEYRALFKARRYELQAMAPYIHERVLALALRPTARMF